MGSLMSYLTAFGLAGGAGAKAFIPVLALGAFHYTEYFELSERFVWVSSPPVMAVLAVLVIAEIIVDANPELGEFAETLEYLPKLAAGFIAFAAATGNVDDSMLKLSASGLLGGATAGAVHWLRNQIRRPFRAYLEDLHGAPGKLATAGEVGASATAAIGAMVQPILALMLFAVIVIAALMMARAIDRRRVPCVHCGAEIRPRAMVCQHCKRDQKEAEQEADTG